MSKVEKQGQKDYSYLSRTYTWALLLIAIFAIVGQIITQYFLNEQNSDGKVINIAGRQRMLSQKISKQALLLHQSQNNIDFIKHKKYLKEALILFKKSHKALQEGNKLLKLPKLRLSLENEKLFLEMQPYYSKIIDACDTLLLINYQQVNNKSQYLIHIINNEPRFLTLMNDIVSQFEKESNSKISTLKTIGVILTIIMLVMLLMIALIIFKPIIKKIKTFIQEIEYKNKELLKYQEKLQNNLEELKTSEEELVQKQEEIASQRDILDIKNKKLIVNEKILKKMYNQLTEYKNKLEYKNETLEEQVIKRTEILLKQNEKFKEYVFLNAHKVRAPLARILGLLEVVEKESKVELFKQYYFLLKDSSIELDEIIKHMNNLLEEALFFDEKKEELDNK